MDAGDERERLERQLEQANRLVTSVHDQTTLQRIREFIGDLKQRLERRRARRRSQDEIRARARMLWESAGRPAGRDEEFWLQAERELTDKE
jgi:hypothetical protein